VIGAKGTIVVGTNDGHLFICRPNHGFVHHAAYERSTQIAEPNFAVQTLAVAVGGTVYSLCTVP
jgi:hypothetical protein